MRCTQCDTPLTAEEHAWGTNLCDGCAIAPLDYAAAQTALQRALDAYLAARPYAVVVQAGGRRYLWDAIAEREDGA